VERKPKVEPKSEPVFEEKSSPATESPLPLVLPSTLAPNKKVPFKPVFEFEEKGLPMEEEKSEPQGMFDLPNFNFNSFKDFEKSEPQGQFVSSDIFNTDNDKSDDFFQACDNQVSESLDAGVWADFDGDTSPPSSPSYMKDRDAVFCPLSPRLVDSSDSLRKRKRSFDGSW